VNDQPTTPGFVAPAVALMVTIALLFGVTIAVRASVASAGERLKAPELEAEKPKVAIAGHAEVAYCTPRFKQVLERVLHSCGLAEGDSRRGCKPADVKTFASISDEDFNELFTPLKDRGAVIMYDMGKEDLDDRAKKLLEDRWFDRKGARYFFVVARASKTGSVDKNRALSHRRANSVMFHLKGIAKDPEIDKKVGLLWLGNEFAQLSKEYCKWPSSRPDVKCDEEPINRSAFVSWVDCRL
jgi:outer membrane protein OmpA-like peptidoglycan-associated protein